MSVLGYNDYPEGHTDGLQILRYNLTKAYIPHMDYLDSDRYDNEGYDYDSAAKGGNRYATILLYMSDLGEHDGGETVFAKGWPVGQPEEEHVKLPQVRIESYLVHLNCPQLRSFLYLFLHCCCLLHADGNCYLPYTDIGFKSASRVW